MPNTQIDALASRFIADVERLFHEAAVASVREALEKALGSQNLGMKSQDLGKRRPGRPKGAKNKPKAVVVTAKAPQTPPAPRFVRLPPKLPRYLKATPKKQESAAVGAMLSDGAGPDSGGPVKPIKRVRP